MQELSGPPGDESDESPEPEPEVREFSPYADPTQEVPAVPAERRYPSTIGGAVYLAVLAATVTGMVIVARGPWRQGIGWIGVSLLVAAATRAVLPDSQAGMLKVRRKALDAALLTFIGCSLLFLATSIPDQPA